MEQNQINRRDFLKFSGLAPALFSFQFPKSILTNPAPTNRLQYAKESTSICSFCGGGCGQIVHTENGKLINVEGDPDHPVNEGALCSKSNATFQVVNNDRRLRKVLYRAPNSTQWEEKPIDWAIKEIAKRVKTTRDGSFTTKDENGVTVNRAEALASLGGAALDNEECYLIAKLNRALGMVYFEHEARLCHSSTVAALGPSFGRGAMTNHWVDIKNSDCILVIGANPVENHVVSARWINVAKEKGAKLIVCDPRFTRTAAISDLFIRHRAGTDIALIGWMINYCLENKLFHDEYVREYTNAPFMVKPEFGFNDGLFSGYDAAKRAYDSAAWDYQAEKTCKHKDDCAQKGTVPAEAKCPVCGAAVETNTKKDMTLNDPNSVFQLLKKHFSRYTAEEVSKITGVPAAQLVELAKTYCGTGKPEKTGTILYAMGATQHTVGAEYIRSYAILQLLLGNMGRPGGGINAMRGESNVQGSTDMALLFHLLPGYLGIPNAKLHPTLKDYNDKETPKTGYWSNKPKFLISLLKAWWGDKATKGNDFCYDYVPKIGAGHKNGGYSWIAMFEAMNEGKIKGLLNWGQNPAVSGPNSNLELSALGKLDWLVDVQLWDTETGNFWQRPGVNPAEIKTEVFVLPAAFALEKEGAVTNSGRWLQWRYQAVNPPGEAKRDLWWLDKLYKEVKALYQKDSGAFADPIVNLNWNYGDEPDVHLVAKEINGYTTADKKQLLNFTKLADDGSTACGNWIYSGFYPGADKKDNKAASRDKSDPSGLGIFPNWTYAWPVNRRIIYNRCSADPKGNPYNPDKALVKWDGVKWITFDVPDFGWKDAKGDMITPDKSAAAPFIMLPELHARLFAPKGILKEGPFPEHYEPYESPVKNLLSSQQFNPVAKIWDGPANKRAEVGSKEYPIIAITFRLTEHWQSGTMTRNLPWQAELMPEMFVEISPQLAGARGIQNGEWLKVVSPRGEVMARACITSRISAHQVNGKSYETVAMPWHYGFSGLVTGGQDRNKNYAANQITPHIGDGNTMIPEYKVFLCNIQKAQIS